jgi:predicted phosphoribosyltransferase
MGRLIEDPDLRNRIYVFRNRAHAGRLLAERLKDYESSDALVLAIPAGGVPVAYEIAKNLGLLMDIVIVRKIQIPGNTEAGFGAVGPDGEVIFNDKLLRALSLTGEEIQMQVAKAKEVLRKRNLIYRKGRSFPDLKERTVILVDDGLASGYTMSEAIRFTERKKAGRIIMAVPTSPESSIKLLLPRVDELYCLNIRGYPFAVADAYDDWYDLSDEEVISLLG